MSFLLSRVSWPAVSVHFWPWPGYALMPRLPISLGLSAIPNYPLLWTAATMTLICQNIWIPPRSSEYLNQKYVSSRIKKSFSQFPYSLPSQGSNIYHISFLWYTGLGACLVMIASNVACLFFGLNDVSKLDDKLVSPFIVKYIQKYKYSEVKVVKDLPLNGLK